MHNALPNELHKTVANLGEHGYSFGLREALTLVHDALEVTSRAELLNDVVVVVALHHIQETNNVGRL
jgi:hypothetical protein